ncbi:MAG TPA: vanadium-dependent haloperoxidase [Gammaproteobacteria bacterium]|nr:vanadium-dependent haloperoxidase [Gammaproteobacteria bacterium]
MNNNEALAPTARPLKRTATAAAVAALLAASWVAPASANVVTEWNTLAMGCIARGGAANALDVALVQAAVHDAIQAIEGRYEPYKSSPPATGNESKAVAAAAAAYRVLSDNRICPAPATGADTVQATLDTAFAPYKYSSDAAARIVGEAAGDAMLAEWRDGTTTIPLPYIGNTAIGQWRPTPPGFSPMNPVFVATKKPFVIANVAQFRPGPAPALTSAEYLKDYNEVKAVGGMTSHPALGACPAPAATDMARFWGANIPAQLNQLLRDVAVDQQLGLGDTARLLALGNLASADAGIVTWDTKIYYNVWRPVTAIQTDDGIPATKQDATWRPFYDSVYDPAVPTGHFPGTPAPSQTPPYPDYPSGANTVSGAFTTILQLFFKTDHMPIAIYKGSAPTVAICTNPRLYTRISAVADEVVEARILLGIHFRFADTVARTIGTRVAQEVFAKALRPLNNNVNGVGNGHAPDDE